MPKMYSKPDRADVDAWLFDGTPRSLNELRDRRKTIRLVRNPRDHDAIHAVFQGRIEQEQAVRGDYIVILPSGHLAVRKSSSLTVKGST